MGEIGGAGHYWGDDSMYSSGGMRSMGRCGHDNNKPPPFAKRTPESERGPFSDPETTFRTIHHGLDGSGYIIYFSDFGGFFLCS